MPTIKAENLITGYQGLAEKFNISIRTARYIVKKCGITKHQATRKRMFFDYKEVYVKYVMGKY